MYVASALSALFVVTLDTTESLPTFISTGVLLFDIMLIELATTLPSPVTVSACILSACPDFKLASIDTLDVPFNDNVLKLVVSTLLFSVLAFEYSPKFTFSFPKASLFTIYIVPVPPRLIVAVLSATSILSLIVILRLSSAKRFKVVFSDIYIEFDVLPTLLPENTTSLYIASIVTELFLSIKIAPPFSDAVFFVNVESVILTVAPVPTYIAPPIVAELLVKVELEIFTTGTTVSIEPFST